jgi:hypothetical protein
LAVPPESPDDELLTMFCDVSGDAERPKNAVSYFFFTNSHLAVSGLILEIYIKLLPLAAVSASDTTANFCWILTSAGVAVFASKVVGIVYEGEAAVFVELSCRKLLGFNL